MSLLNRLRPKWQNTDPDVRVDAVRQLGKNDIELLTAVAQQDTDARVRKIAIKKLDAPKLLLELAQNDDDESVRTSALTRARHLLVHIACDTRDADESTRALELLTQPDDIAVVADRAHFDAVRTHAFARLGDDAAYAAVIYSAKTAALRKQALERIQEPATLKDVVLDERSGELAALALNRIEDVAVLEAIAEHGGASKSIRRSALTKLLKLVPADHPAKAAERERQFSEVCRQVDELESTGADGAVADVLTSLESEWNAIQAHGAPSDELARRFDDAVTRIRERALKGSTSAPAEPIVVATEPEPEPEPEQASSGPDAAIAARVETFDDSGLADAIQSARAEWDALETKSADATARFDKAIKDAESRLAGVAERETRRQELAVLLAEAEAASLGKDSELAARALGIITKKWRSLESVADVEAKGRYAHLEERARNLKEAKQREQEAAEQKNLAKIQACEAKLVELADASELSLKDANKALRDAANLLKTMGPLARSVNRKKMRRELSDAREKLFKKTQDVRAIEDWKRWANADIQNGLIKRIETLRESRDTPKVAKELRAIHEEWKKAGAAPSEKADELWQRYKTVRDELKARCDEFFAKQNKERLENLKKKEALCEEVEAIADSEDWNKTADAIKAIQEKWKKIGPPPQQRSDAVWRRFRKACDQFFARRKGHFDELKDERGDNLKKKEALCEQAETIQESTDWRTTADTLKRLQIEWKSIGAVPHKKSEQVWKRFRKSCDYFFDRYKRRDEVEREERLKERDALVERALELAKTPGDDGSDDVAKTMELWSNWKSLGPTPEANREVQQRFDAAVCELIAKAPEAFADTELDPVASQKKRERLVARLEKLTNVAEVAKPADTNELEDLAQRLKDALASNTMTGGKPQDKRDDGRASASEARKIKASWLRTTPVPGDEGRALSERFEAAYGKLHPQNKK